MCKLGFGVASCFHILTGIWHISYFFFTFCPAIIWTWETSLKDLLWFDAELIFVAANVLQKYPFPVPSLCKLNHISVCFIQFFIQNHLQTAYSLQGKQCFIWSHPRCFGPLGKFWYNIKISFKTARVSRISFRFLWLCFHLEFFYLYPKWFIRVA